jgi:uncharacterized OB-fold protein
MAEDASLAPFYEAAKAGTLNLAYCPACERYELPGSRTCPECLGRLEWRPGSGRGEVFSYVVFHRALHPDFEVPYAVCTIELEEGPRIVGQLADVPADEVAVGIAVTAVFPDGTGDGPPVRWQPAPPTSETK